MFVRLFVALLVFALLVTLWPRLITWLHARSRLVTVTQAPEAPVAIVFGAGLRHDGGLTPVLQDRVATAVRLYLDGKVSKLLLSGDNRFVDYNEPGAMAAYAQSLGVPQEALVLDFAGRRTYDTCYRAGAIFGVRQALLVTQAFHLPRALFLCNALGVEALGVSADRHTYRNRSLFFWQAREIPATLTAFIDLYITHPLPVLGEPEPIFETKLN